MKTMQKALILFFVLAAISIAHAAIAPEPTAEVKAEVKVEQTQKPKEEALNKSAKLNETEEEEYKMTPQQKKLAACITLFYYQQKKDKVEWLKLKKLDKNATVKRRPKLEALILSQCIKTIPDSSIDAVNYYLIMLD
jgi:Na+-translocating ferredoxin:NAD+ oxidoreductase RnfG subunit